MTGCLVERESVSVLAALVELRLGFLVEGLRECSEFVAVYERKKYTPPRCPQHRLYYLPLAALHVAHLKSI